MKIVVADDEALALDDLIDNIKKIDDSFEIISFNKAKDVLKYAQNNIFDVAFLDIEMGPYSGLKLAKELKKINPELNIIFVTGYSEYMHEAIKLRASGYVLKPSTVNDIKEELANLRYKIPNNPKLFIRCFGDFDVFYNGKSLTFEKSKTKELLAYLVDRKGSGELRAILWEEAESDRNTNSYLSKLMKDLLNTLKDYDLSDIIIKDWNTYAIDVTKVKCDYYDYLNNKIDGIRAYNGEYMSQYSWPINPF